MKPMLNGVLNLDKATKISSFKAMETVKRALKVKKAGYIGTLDPFATGVLPVCLGEATKIIPYIDDQIKEYEAVLHLGVRTDTLDRSGTVVSCQTDLRFSEEEVCKSFKNFYGDIEQIPPMFSALKFNGKRLYQLARVGVEVPRKPRRVQIYDLKIRQIELPEIKFWVRCSKGTYIRALAASIADDLGCGGHLSELRRIRSGPFKVLNSITSEKLLKSVQEANEALDVWKFMVSVSSALSSIPKVEVSNSARRKVLNGSSIFFDELSSDPETTSAKIGDPIRVEDESGTLLCIGRSLVNFDSLMQVSANLPVCRPERVLNMSV